MEKMITGLKKTILDYLCCTSDIDEAMNDILALVGTYFNVDRAYVFENSEDGRCCSNTYEWCNDGIESEINNLQNVRYQEDLGGIWQGLYDEEGIYFCRDVKVLPDNIRAIVEPQHITSMLQCAIRVYGEFKGYIGFDNCSDSIKGWETDQDAIDTLVYTSHLLTLYLLDYRKKSSQLMEEDQRMQQKLRQANDMFEDLLTNVNCGVAIYNVSSAGKIEVEYINDGLSALAECTKDDLREAALKDTFVTINRPCRKDVEKAFKRVIDGDKTGNVTYQATSFKGRHKWITVELSASHKNDGTVCIYGTFFDVTSEMETRRELQKKYELEKQRSMNDNNMLAYAVFNLTDNYTVEMERRRPLIPLIMQMSMEDFRDDIASCILSGEKRREFKSMFNVRDLLKKYKNGIDQQNMEFQRTLPSGKVIWVKSSFHIVAEPGGEDILLFYYCRDINLHKTFEIMTSFMANEDYDMLGCINFYDDSAIMMYGKNSIYKTYGNEKDYQEENYSESLDWFVNNAVVPEERDKYRSNFFVDNIKKELSLHGSYEFQIHVTGKYGKRLTKKIHYTRYNTDSKICFFTQVDITQLISEEERKQQTLKDALLDAEKANEAKTSFLSRMSHDMRTPMNGILGLAALSSDETDLDVLRDNIHKIKESGDYLLSLINDTLDFQRIESGKMVLDKHIVDTQDVLDGILDIVHPSMDKKKINFKVLNEGADLNWHIRLDAVHFKQIFINLLSNAIKFTPEGGNISFVFGCNGREGMISHDYIRVSDNGIGMSEDFIKNHLFKPFSQESSEVSSQYAGSGLGLSIVHSLVELMGGRIEVESRLGAGTTFTVYLDFERVEHEKAQKQIHDAGRYLSDASRQLQGKHILLVEDHPLNAEIAKRMLSKVGCIVDWQDNGQKGVDAVKESSLNYYDAVLMDIRMPVMDGLDASKAIRGLERDDVTTMPIIAMTANAYDEDVQQVLSAGMNAHLSKPIEIEKLYAVLSEQMNSGK